MKVNVQHASASASASEVATPFADATDFSSLLDWEFKPKTQQARDAVGAAVRTLAEQALVNAVTLPEQWTPELTVKVSWTIGDYTLPWSQLEPMTPEQRSACCWKQRTLTKTVPVERYGKEGGRVQVFFLPDDEIKVWVSDLGLGHARHPSGVPYPQRPAEAE